MMVQTKNRLFPPNDPYKCTMLFIFIATLLYTCARALMLSITHDEALTLSWHASAPIIQIFLYQTPGLPDNNHLLHTILTKLTTFLFGNSEFVARLPSLSGCALYLFGSYRSLCLISRKKGLIIGALIMSLHPYLVDFFSIARGYSLGLGFTMLGIYYSLEWTQNPITPAKSTSAILSSLMFALAAISNLSFLVLYTGNILILFIYDTCLFRKTFIHQGNVKLFITKFLVNCISFLSYSLPLVLLTSIVPIFKIKRKSLFKIGGTESFWQDTVGSLIKKSLYGKQYIPQMETIAHSLILIIIALGIWSIIYKHIYKKRINNEWYSEYLFSLLIVCTVISVVQHHLLDIAFLTERRAIFFIPIFLLFFICVRSTFLLYLNRWRLFLLPSVNLIAVVLILYFLSCVNLTSYIDWKYDASTKSVMLFLKGENNHADLPNRSKSLGINWRFEPSINYYISRYNLNWLKWVDRQGSDGNFDYYYEFRENKEIIRKHNLEKLQEYPISETYLAQQH